MRAAEIAGRGQRTVRVAVVDGHPTVCLGLRQLLSEDDLRMVGECETGEEALRLVEEACPDLIILGLNLTGEKDGIEICRKMKSLSDPPYVLVHTAYNTPNDILSCLDAGADSYVHKRTGCRELLDAIRRTASGEQVLRFGGRVGDPRSHEVTVPEESGLTPRELEVLALKAQRRTNAEIAAILHISVHTVKRHVNSIQRKTGKEIKDFRRP